MAHVIGVDVGTTGTKVILLDTARGIVASHSTESPLLSNANGHAEADEATWVDNTAQGIAAVLRASGVAGEHVEAIATTGMVPAVVLLDQNLRPVRHPILQNDVRASREIDEIEEVLIGIDLLAVTGSVLTQQSVAPTLLWLSRHEPEAWKRAAHVVGSYDYLLIALGADPHVEANWALESGLYDLDGHPVETVLGAARIDPERLPPIKAPGDVVGTLSPEMADRLGLSHRCALVVGGADHVLSAYAAGVDAPGDWIVKLGGAGDLLVASESLLLDRRLYLDRHPKAGIWLPNACMATSGSLIRWYQQLTGSAPLSQLDDEAAGRTPASLLCLPYFLGEKSPLNDPLARGVFAGLHLGHTRADLYRAILESIAFGFRRNADIFRELGVDLGRAVVTNGGSNSRFWMQIHADVLGVPLFPVLSHPGASLGAAIAAGRGVGAIGQDASASFVELDEPISPRAELTDIYSEAYADWLDLSAVTADVSHRLASRTMERDINE